MADREFLRLSARWDLAYDHNQWIIRKRVSADVNPRERWKAVSFIGGTKETLLRCLAEKGATIDPSAWKALRALPTTFYEWLATHDPAAWRKTPAGKRMQGLLSVMQELRPAPRRSQAPKKPHRASTHTKSAHAKVG